MKGYILYTFISLLCLLITVVNSSAMDKKKLAIFPFTIHSENNSKIIKKMIQEIVYAKMMQANQFQLIPHDQITKSLENQPIQSETHIITIANTLQADYLLTGNMSSFGNSYSLSGRFLNCKHSFNPIIFSGHAKSKDEVIPLIHSMADYFINQIRNNTSISYDEEKKSSDNPPLSSAIPFKRITINKFPTLHHGINGICLENLTEDPYPEIIIIDDHDLYIYKIQKDTLQCISRFSNKIIGKLLTVDCADLDQNGKKEIYISATNDMTQKLSSFVLEWDPETLKPKLLLDYLSWYLRIIDLNDQTKMLIGQHQGLDSFFSSKIYELYWLDNQLQTKQELSLPEDIIFSSLAFGRFMDHTFVYAGLLNNKLCLMDSKGEIAWLGEIDLGDSLNSMTLNSKKRSRTTQIEKHMFLPQRILVSDINKNGKDNIIAIQHNTSVSFFKRLKQIESSSITIWEWGPLGMEKIRSFDPIQGYISDFTIYDLDQDNRLDGIIAVVYKTKLFQKMKSAIIYYSNIQQN